MTNPSIAQLQTAIYSFWKQHGGKQTKLYSAQEKIELADAFIAEQHAIWDEHLEAIREQMRGGKEPVKTLMDMKVTHPAYYRKGSVCKANIYDIVADFITYEQNAIDEAKQEYPMYSEAQELSRTQTRMKHEQRIVDVDSDDDVRQPFNTVSTDDISKQLAARPDYSEVTKERMYELIDDYKTNIDDVVDAYLKMPGCKYDRQSLRRKIQLLNYDNVKECAVCGNVFYAKDKRTDVCDITVQHIERGGILLATEKSACWHKRNAQKTRRNKGRRVS